MTANKNIKNLQKDNQKSSEMGGEEKVTEIKEPGENLDFKGFWKTMTQFVSVGGDFV